MTSCYKSMPEKCPSIQTIRRAFEPPNRSRNVSSRYKSDIEARPGAKRNDAPAAGDVHPHTYECLTEVRYTK